MNLILKLVWQYLSFCLFRLCRFVCVGGVWFVSLFFKAGIFFSSLEEREKTVGLTSVSSCTLHAQVVFTDRVLSYGISSNGPWKYYLTIF